MITFAPAKPKKKFEMKKYLLLCLLSATLFGSCIKDEPQNSECDITSAWVEGLIYQPFFYQPKTDMRIDNVLTSQDHITFIVRRMNLMPKIPVHFQLTPGATISPENGSAQNFRKGPVVYTVTSEDGAWQRRYTVEFREAELPALEYHFENVDLKKEDFLIFNYQYYKWYETDEKGKRVDIWASGNQGFGMGNSSLKPEQYPTTPDEDGYKGRCVKLTTLNAGPLAEAVKKYIAAGNLFIGSFDVNRALTESLRSTLMGDGNAFSKEPVKVSGYYKYKPGDVFTDEENHPQPGMTDQADIYAVLYRNQDSNGNKVVLDGGNVLTSPYIVRRARMESLPATDQWTPFEMYFDEVAPIDYQLLEARGYNLALVFSSSKDGALFRGAVGSTLYIDEVTVSVEK